MIMMSSRQRLLNALDCLPVDHPPCCFMSFTALRNKVDNNFYELAKAEKKMGLDSMLFIPSLPRRERVEHPELRGLPVRFHPDVRTREWQSEDPVHGLLLCKEYITPAGTLSTRVRVTADWPHGSHIPFIDDFQVSRAIEFLVKTEQDLDSLQYLLQPVTDEDIAAYRTEAHTAREFVTREDLLLVGGWGVGVDMAVWLCGMQNFILMTMEQPAFAEKLLQIIHDWNRTRMEIILRGKVDLFIRRAWYEGVDFITPRFYRRVVLPMIQKEAQLARQFDTRFGYILSSGTKPLLDDFLSAGIDVIIGADPVQGTYTDLPLMKEKLGGKICIWGGVSGAVTVEMGSEDEIRAAVRDACRILGPDGFILSPVDNITVDVPQTWKNLAIFLDEWQKFYS